MKRERGQTVPEVAIVGTLCVLIAMVALRPGSPALAIIPPTPRPYTPVPTPEPADTPVPAPTWTPRATPIPRTTPTRTPTTGPTQALPTPPGTMGTPAPSASARIPVAIGFSLPARFYFVGADGYVYRRANSARCRVAICTDEEPCQNVPFRAGGSAASSLPRGTWDQPAPEPLLAAATGAGIFPKGAQ